jgi:hypothetical protein
MSYTYLLGQEGGSWEECSSDTPQFALWNLNLTAEKSYSKDNETASCQDSQSGMMSAPSMENLGEEKSMSSQGDSLAKMLVSQIPKVRELKEVEAVFGLKCTELLARLCPHTFLLKTPQCLLLAEDQELLAILPRWGMIVDGVLWEVATPTVLCVETECGYLPAAVASDGKHHGKEKWIANSRLKRKSLGKSAPTEKITYAYYEAGIPMKYFPEISEDVMSFPVGWTDLLPLEMHKFHLWRQQHGESLEENK